MSLTPMLHILDPLDERWNDLICSHPSANIFHHPKWSKVIADSYGYRPFVVAVLDEAKEIGAALPCMELNSHLTGRRWVSLPFTDHCVPLVRNPAALDFLTESLASLAGTKTVPSIELRGPMSRHPALHPRGGQVLHILLLNARSEQVRQRFHTSHRRNIKTAEKRGVRIEWGTNRAHLEEFYRLHLETRRRQGIPIQPWSFFDLLWRELIQPGCGFVLLAYKEKECLAAAVFLHWQQTLTYKYGASSRAGLGLRPNDLLFWSAIRWGCENGFTFFDLGKSDVENKGLRAFKSGWGADETPLNYYQLSCAPNRSLQSQLMPIMESVIRHSPPWVCRAAGELLYGHFGN